MSRFLGKRHKYIRTSETAGLSVQEILEWIESVPNTAEAHQKNILKLNDAVRDLIAYGEAAVEPLINRLLNTNNNWTRWGTVWALREIGDTRAADALWTIYRRAGADLGDQTDILIALSRLKDERLFDILVPLLNHQNIHVRRAAIRAFGILGDHRAVDLLTPLIDFPNVDIRISVIGALGNLKDQRPLEMLISRIPKAELNETHALIAAFGEIGSSKSVQALDSIINAEDVPSLESSQYDRLRIDAIRALAEMPEPEAKTILQNSLNHPKRGVRRAARTALEKSSNQSEIV